MMLPTLVLLCNIPAHVAKYNGGTGLDPWLNPPRLLTKKGQD